MPEERKDNWAAGKLYEPYVGRWSRLVAKDFLQWLGLPAQLDWLDVGCGTGALTQAILQQTQPRSVTGVDPSAGFIDYAKAQVNDPRVTFEVADAHRGALRDRIRATLPIASDGSIPLIARAWAVRGRTRQ